MYIELAKNPLTEDSVILIDGWKNSTTNVRLLRNMADGKRPFLDAWNLSGEAETANRLCDIVVQSIQT